MTAEYQALIRILADHIHNRPSRIEPEIRWEALLNLARAHQVEGILYSQIRSCLPAEWEQELKNRYILEKITFSERERALEEVREQFYRSGISYVMVKGLELSRLYPDPALRTMADLDILVHPEDKAKAHDCMIALGYENQWKQEIEWTYRKRWIQFEIHDHLLYREPVNTEASIAYTDRVWERTDGEPDHGQYRVDWSFHVVFLFLHLRKHLLNRGAGIRLFLDLALTVRDCRPDWGRIERDLEELELLPFARVCLAMTEYWFGISAPLLRADDRPDEETCRVLTEQVLNNGLFGYADESNRDNKTIRTLSGEKGCVPAGRVRVFLNNAFPPYRLLRYTESYGFVDGRPYLLPAAWGYRFFLALRDGKWDRGRELIGQAAIPRSQIDRRNDYLRLWKLRI